MTPVFLLAYEFYILKPFKREVHTEIRIFGNDYWFETNGPRHTPSRNKEQLPYDGSDYTLLAEISCGSSRLSQTDFEMYIDAISFEFQADQYRLFSRNCRNYSKDLLAYLHPDGVRQCRQYLSDLVDNQDYKEKLLAAAALVAGVTVSWVLTTGGGEDSDEKDEL